MKRCPECRRDYYDDSLLYCLEDGVALVQGAVPVIPVSAAEPATAILHETSPQSEAETRSQIPATETSGSGIEAGKQSLTANLATPLLIGLTIVILAIGAVFGYRYLNAANS